MTSHSDARLAEQSISERLRTMDAGDTPYWANELMVEAANEIERLQAELADIKERAYGTRG